jgi:phytoene dehydrogenase-like protein
MNQQTEIAVIGGGLAGLAAAAYAARSGSSVTLLERSSLLGGKAITNDLSGYKFNLGPHALYRGAAGMKALREFGIKPKGGVPPFKGAFVHNGRAQPLSIPGLVTTGFLSVSGKMQLARALASVQLTDPKSLRAESTRDWLARTAGDETARSVLEALVRVGTYTNNLDMSAEVAVLQMKLAGRGNVLYIDGGWQTLVDGLSAVAEQAGARLMTSSRVSSIEQADMGFSVRVEGAPPVRATSVIVATEPHVAAQLTSDAELRAFADRAIPVRAACLDIAVRGAPKPQDRFALGIDKPHYFSIHSGVAQLAPEDGAAMLAAKYLAPDDAASAEETQAELEALVDLMQPGWRDVLVEKRFLPNMTVVNALATPPNGLAGRPAVATPSLPGVFLAGDWVGDTDWLSDACYASAKRAAMLAANHATERAQSPSGERVAAAT